MQICKFELSVQPKFKISNLGGFETDFFGLEIVFRADQSNILNLKPNTQPYGYQTGLPTRISSL